MIRYLDTRGAIDAPRTFTEAILEGIAPGGGLFVPERLPRFTVEQIVALADVPYHARAAAVYEAFGLDVTAAKTREIAARAYGPNFDEPEVAPVREVAPGRHVLELWHGPTLAFKDMALQCMPLYFSEALEQAHAKGATDLDFLILVATSGDTGVAALNGFADRAHTRICVYYPDAGVSALQELQMVTQPGDEPHRVPPGRRLRRLPELGQGRVRRRRLRRRAGRAASPLAELGQLHQLGPPAPADRLLHERLRRPRRARRGRRRRRPSTSASPPATSATSSPPGTRGTSACPSGRLLCASNSNNVLYDFLSSGVYDIAARSLVKTPSPSMDILISSNLERLLYDLTGDPARIAGWMAELKTTGRFAVDDETREKLRASFVGEWVDNDTCLQVIGRVQREQGYLLDPHTAVAWEAAERLAGDAPVLIASTAHWSKFAADVVRGLTGVPAGAPVPGAADDLELLDRVVDLAPGASVPPQLRAVRARPRRFDARVEAGREPVEASLRAWLAGS